MNSSNDGSRFQERIDEDKIFLNGCGKYPKELIIRENGKIIKTYSLKKTINGKYLLN